MTHKTGPLADEPGALTTDNAEAALDELLGSLARVSITGGQQFEEKRRRFLGALRAALAAAPAAYPLPDDLYGGSKDWAHGDYAQRVEWLHTAYESTKAERDMLLQQLAAPAAPAEPRLLVTDEQIDNKANAIDTEPAFCTGYFNGWREAEQHHGIGAAPAAGEGA